MGSGHDFVLQKMPANFLLALNKYSFDRNPACSIICHITCNTLCHKRSNMAKSRKIRMPKEKKTEVAEMIRNLRVKLELTQEQFAAKVGVTWSTVNRWENGRGKPSPLAMRRIEELQKEFEKE